MSATYDFSHYPGDSIIINATYQAGTPAANVDLTGYTGNFSIVAQCGPEQVVIDAEGGEITLGSSGQINVNIPSAKTERLVGAKKVIYQLRVTSSGQVTTTLLVGTITILKAAIEVGENING